MRGRSSGRERGASLVEVGLTLIVLGIIATAAVRARQAETQRDLDRAAGQHVKLLQLGLQRYLDDFRTELLAGAAITGVADVLNPTGAELRAIGALGQSLGDVGPTGLTFTFRVARLPAGCVPTVNCTDMQGLLWSSELRSPGGPPQPARVGESLLAAGVDAAIPNVGNTAQLRGLDGVWTFPNPDPSNPAAIIAARAGFGSTTNLDRFLPRDGSRPMVGTLNMNGNDIAAANAITATTLNSTTINNTGTVSTQALSATGTVTAATVASGTATVTGQTTTGSLSVNNNAAVGGSLTAASASVTGALSAGSAAISGNIAVQGEAQITNDLITTAGVLRLDSSRTEGSACASTGALSRTSDNVLLACGAGSWRRVSGQIANEGDACATDGLAGVATDDGTAMSCRGGRYIKLRSLLPRLVADTVAVVANGSAVNKPSCGVFGTPWVMPAPAAIATPDGAFNVLVDDFGGATWTVRIVDGGGGPAGSSPQAIVLTGCRI